MTANLPGVTAVFRKFEQVLVFAYPAARSPDCTEMPATPREFMQSLTEAAGRAAPFAILLCEDERALACDFLAFLAQPPQSLIIALADESVFPPEPARAWNEVSASVFWQLASLIQDVWEHSVGPERAVDAHILQELLRLVKDPIYDLGAGAGRFGCALGESGFTVRCAENNVVKRMFLRFRIARHGLSERVHLRRNAALYETVVAINVLDHVASPPDMLRALLRRLARQGRLIYRAGFPDDGWHQGSQSVRQAVHAILIEHFEPWMRMGGSPILATLTRRLPGALPLGRQSMASAKTCLTLDPGAAVMASPDGECSYVAVSTTHCAPALIVSGTGLALLHRLHKGMAGNEVEPWAMHHGIDRQEIWSTIQRFIQAGLICAHNES